MRRTAIAAPLLAAALAPLLVGAAPTATVTGPTAPPAVSRQAVGPNTVGPDTAGPDTAGPNTAGPTATGPTVTTGPYTVGVIDTDTQGRVFTDPDFRLLYRDIADNPAKGAFDCVRACLKLYHPLLTTPGAALALPPGVAGAVSSVVRPDGAGDQVTVDGYAVYTFSGGQPGETGGLSATWHAVPAPVQR